MDPSVVAAPMTLPARYYVSRDLFREEADRIHGRMWVYAGRSDEIAATGDFVTREIAGENLILARGEGNRPRAFFNVCRHRGTRICEESAGQARKRLQCAYHAWTWDLDGKLVAAPHMDATPGFDRADYPLIEAKIDEWDGHLFVNLDPDASPLREQLADLPEKFAPWGMADLRLGRRIVYDVAANWKLIVQNYSECLHCPTIHPALAKLSHYLSGVNEDGGVGSTYLGGKMDLRDGIQSMSNEGTLVGRRLPRLDSARCRIVQYYAILPNLLLSLHPDYMMTHRLRPIDVDRTEIVCEWHFLPQTLADPAFDPTPAIEFWDVTNRQDWHVSEISQQGLNSRAYRRGPYSVREELLHAFDLWLLDKLGHEHPTE